MAQSVYKLTEAANNMAEKHDVDTIRNAVNKYYNEHKKKVDCLLESGSNLITKNTPINAEAVGYEFQHQRTQRLINDVNDIAINDNNQNWSINQCQISTDDSNPSLLEVSLKFGVLLTVTIDFEYPLKPPKCELQLKDSQKWNKKKPYQSWINFKQNHPSISGDTITLFETVWSSSLTLHDIVHFCSIIPQGGDASSVIKTYVKMHHNSKMKTMLETDVMKDYLLKYTNPVCKCGAEMQQINTKECYGNEYSFVICDGCDIICNKQYGIGKEIVYHCPNKKIQNIHPDGYDVCFECVYKNHLRYRQFNALIISPLLREANGEKVDSKDADELEKMFKQLGYHNIINLKDDETSTAKIKSSIDTLYHQKNSSNINAVNVIVYTGHGHNQNNQFFFDIADGHLSDVELKQWIYGAQNDENHANDDEKYNDAADGYAKCKKALYNVANNKVTFHRQNTIILINACHSGGFKSLNQTKENAKKSGILENAINDIANEMGFDLNTVINQQNKESKMNSDSKFKVDDGFVLIDNDQQINENEMISNSKADAEEQKIDAKDTFLSMKLIDDTLNEVMNEISYNTHSALVISSCKKNETSNFFVPVSPFVEYTLDFLKKCYKEIQVKSDEMISSYSQLSDTPIKLYQYIYQKGQMPHHETEIILSDSEWKQNVTVASKRGSDQFVLCPMYR